MVSQRDFAAVLESAVFDQDFYLKTYPDIAQAGVNPLLHYLESGRFEKRKASATFDPAAYLEANPEVANSGIEPFLHDVLIGRAAGAPRSRVEVTCRNLDWTTRRQPVRRDYRRATLRRFAVGRIRSRFYLKTYPDIAQAGVNPLLHYLESGRFEKRKASATFDPAAYLEANPEVANSGIEPFLHYVLIGRAAGAPRSRVEVTFRKLGLDYEATARAAGLSQGDFETILLSGVFDQDFYLKTYPTSRKRASTRSCIISRAAGLRNARPPRPSILRPTSKPIPR